MQKSSSFWSVKKYIIEKHNRLFPFELEKIYNCSLITISEGKASLVMFQIFAKFAIYCSKNTKFSL